MLGVSPPPDGLERWTSRLRVKREIAMKKVQIPISDEVVRSLEVGDPIALSGVMVTARDAAHKWLMDTFITHKREPQGDDLEVYEALKKLLNGGVIYHCGPVVTRSEDGEYHFVAAGPTTSIREEPYQGDIMRHFNVKGVIGKGGMGAKTLQACQDVPGLYLHAVGGAASWIAQTVKRVLGVYKLEFGVPEAFWVIEVEDFPVVVTMDANGNSLHAEIEARSAKVLEDLLTGEKS
ncbi:FumA C-terminus/TtdB family hydratase beta subunit [Anaerolinea sp.]|uniref:FumA C-terminus/TtdB family hydratase beta subunit n=1 Tax=Anaerolinea sp. TaxID=1872519 RepID=UPI002ACE713D|nr:FumA C-terminus/TtdB family hydratase beta subunit [Anaerolinea sp.]